MRPRKNGGWLSPFDPKEVNNNFTEGNSWQYTFFVPQDINELIEKMGGSEKFEKKLDELFSTDSKTTGRDQADISGLIGQYAHGNEPSHHMTYLYDFIGKPSKTQERVHQVLTDFYKPKPDGLIGNEDCGQMSAWYVLSAMGFYQVSPGSSTFVVGSPTFKSVKINLESGKNLLINAPTVSDKNIYIKESNFIKTNHDMSYFAFADVMSGGIFSFEMTDKPIDANLHSWGRPIAFYKPDTIIPAPIISANSKVFSDSAEIKISSPTNDSIFFVISNSAHDSYGDFYFYKKPFTVLQNALILSYCRNGQKRSQFVDGRFYKRPNNWKIKINSKYNPQYTADGDEGIIDGLRGDANWRKGGWQGYQAQDFECVIDLGEEKEIKKLSAGFLQDEGAWILMPKKAEYYVSSDGKNFTLAATVANTVEEKDSKVRIKDFAAQLKTSAKARYIKVKAYNYGKLPAWHESAEGDAFVFIDEITVE